MWGTNTVPKLDDALRSAGEQFVRRNSSVEPVLLRTRDLYARTYVRTTQLSNRVRYDAPVEPYRLLRVDPADVEYAVGRWHPMFREAGVVDDGDWDQTDVRFEEMDVYRAYERHFEDGVPWQETAFFDRVVDELDAGAQRWGCRTRSEFEARCRRLDALYESIAEEGYCSQEELYAESVDDPIKNQSPLKTERFKHEIAVHVGRDGALLFADGRNRLCIANLLGLDEIPVRVLRRHTEWQAVRDAYVRGESEVGKFAGHPDLAYLERGDS